MSAVDLDKTDHQIIELLSQNARRTMADIGERVSLSASAVTRRIERLERSGVIAGYTVVVDHRKAGRPIQAFTEVRFAGTADLKEIKETAIQLPEVQAVFTTAGDPDALVWLQVPDVERLGQVIEQLRRRGRVTGTKTLIVLDTWSPPADREPSGLTGRFRPGRAPAPRCRYPLRRQAGITDWASSMSAMTARMNASASSVMPPATPP
jgi:Lrp/AsnC family leucine-responsive transcriptional regulator